MAYEWLVEARDGGSCVVRLVNSGFGEGDDWDAQYHGMAEGWKIFLANLRLHLTHFRGRAARPVIPTVMLPGPRCGGLGRPVRRARHRPRRHRRRPHHLRRRRARAGRRTVVEAIVLGRAPPPTSSCSTHPAPGTGFVAVEGDGEQVGASVYLYLYDTDDPDVGARWTSWMAQRFPGADATDVLDPAATWSPGEGAAGGGDVAAP